MFDKPNIQEALLIKILNENYRLNIQSISFLPWGADRNTAVYRACSEDNAEYFVKLRKDDFNEMSLLVPKFLQDHKVQHILAPLNTYDKKLWVQVSEFYLSVYPFIAGDNAYETGLTDKHWMEFGEVLKGIHKAKLPQDILSRIPKEDFSDIWINRIKKFLIEIDHKNYEDPISKQFADLLKKKLTIINTLIQGAEIYGKELKNKNAPFVLCHADIHAWNMQIQKDGNFYIIDWDTILLAPKERDLMFVASGLFKKERTPEQEEALFYKTYGDINNTDQHALIYYRCERILRDLVEYCEEIFLSSSSKESRELAFHQISSQFEAGSVVNLALRS